MMKELSKTGYSLAVIQAIALRMAFACWLLFTTFPILAQEHSVSLHLNHVSLLEAINEIKRQSNLNLMYSITTGIFLITIGISVIITEKVMLLTSR